MVHTNSSGFVNGIAGDLAPFGEASVGRGSWRLLVRSVDELNNKCCRHRTAILMLGSYAAWDSSANSASMALMTVISPRSSWLTMRSRIFARQTLIQKSPPRCRSHHACPSRPEKGTGDRPAPGPERFIFFMGLFLFISGFFSSKRKGVTLPDDLGTRTRLQPGAPLCGLNQISHATGQ